MLAGWQIGDRIENRWEIGEILRGGMGVVYLVYDHEFRRPFAAKTFQPEVFRENPAVAERFKREALAWVKLDRHMNVTEAEFVEDIADQPFLFLEYVSGGDLGAWIGTPRLTEDLQQVLRFAIQFCDGMSHALSKGIKAHRDVKPQNCLITGDGTLKVTDFGLATVLDVDEPCGSAPNARRGFFGRLVFPGHQALVQRAGVTLTQTGTTAGTSTHMAPEQFDDAKHVDVRADVYSFGVMLYQMATGRLPFPGRSWEDFERLHKTETPPLIPDREKHRLNPLIQRCLAKDPSRRFPDFASLRQRLAGLYEETTGKSAPWPVIGAELDAGDWNNKGLSLHRLGRDEEGLACFDRALEIDAQCKEAWANKGILLIGRPEESLGCLDRALAIDPAYSPAWFGKGHVLGELRREQEALECFEKGLAISPQQDRAWFSKGLLLCKLGRTRDAVACFDWVLRMKPSDVDAWFARGTALAATDHTAEAIESFDKAIALKPTFAKAWCNKGGVLASLNRIEEAIACYDRALEQPHDVHEEVFLHKGKALGQLHRWPEALRCFEEVLRFKADDERAWYNMSLVFRALGRMQDAVASCDRALEIKPDYGEALFSKARALAGLSRWPEALACLDRAVDLDPLSESNWFQRGGILRQLGRWSDALTCFDRAIQLNRSDAQAWINKGISLAAGFQDYEQAVVCFQEAQRLGDPEAAECVARCVASMAVQGRSYDADAQNGAAWFTKGNELARLRRDEEAVACFERAVSIDPNFKEAWFNLGVELGLLGRYEEAITCYDRVLSLDPRYPDAWTNKGMALAAIGHRDEELVCYDRAIDSDPRDERAWFNKGVVLSEAGRTEDALACYERAIETNPNLAEAWFQKGFLLGRLGRPEQAIGCHERALALNPNDERAWFNKGVELGNLGRTAEEIECYVRVTTLDPHFVDAWFNRGLAFGRMRQWREALKCFETAHRLGDSDAAHKIVLCRRALGQGQ